VVNLSSPENTLIALFDTPSYVMVRLNEPSLILKQHSRLSAASFGVTFGILVVLFHLMLRGK
jgi:hypothetical protein